MVTKRLTPGSHPPCHRVKGENAIMRIHLSDGTSYDARLVVRRDWCGPSRASWSLAWENPNGSGYVDETSRVTGSPYFRTMRAAIAAGIKRHGATAVRVDW